MSIDIQFVKTHTPNKRLAVLCFDNPSSLNAQTTDMVKTISQALTDWQDDDSVVAVVLRGAGEKAFCAGGDIRTLYKDSLNNDGQATPNPKVAEFFEHEYALIYQMYTYTKPIIAWGNGIVMGGGLGLLAASSHKVLTEATLMAMPEVSIGLFPDVAGSFFLKRMMGKVGLFLGLTGARWQAKDALYLSLGDCIMPKDDYLVLLDELAKADWTTQDTHGLTNSVLAKLHTPNLVNHQPILDNFAYINHLMNAGDMMAVDKALRDYQGDNDFINTAIASYKAGCPATAMIVWQLYHKAATWSLAQVLTVELNTALACCVNGDFVEGVRALLIDKDKNPRWKYRLDNLPDGYIDSHFDSPYQVHPFDKLDKFHQ